jgi:co-chaperonin GroES (HSP10)
MISVRGDRVVIEPLEDPDQIGRIIIPEIAKNRADQGIVVYIGPRVRFLEVGDLVMFSTYSGTNVTLEGEGTRIIMREVAVVCKLHPVDTEIPGLFLRDKSGQYFPATYDRTAYLLKRAFEDPEWKNKYGILGKSFIKRKKDEVLRPPRDTTKDEEYNLASEDEEEREFRGEEEFDAAAYGDSQQYEEMDEDDDAN